MLRQYSKEFNYELFSTLAAQKRNELVEIDYWNDLRELMSALEKPRDCYVADLSDVVSVGSSERIEVEQHELLDRIIKRLIPWRKGPFRIFGHDIDSEWRSNMKWDRIAPVIGNLDGKRVADIGCGNGYYMMRLSGLNPQLVIGLDPNAWAWHQFQLVQHYVSDQRLCFELLGIEDITLFPGFFDLILCMGVIYHRRDPMASLRDLRDSLRAGGRLIMESMTVPLDGPYALCPPDRYTKLRNVWFVPSEDCLYSWLKRSNFSSIEKVSTSDICPDEQRKTEFAPYESLEDFLDPEDSTKTIEGFPAPKRTVFVAVK